MNQPHDTAPDTALGIVEQLRNLAAPLDRVGNLTRWQRAFAKAAQADDTNPALADIMDLVLLTQEAGEPPETGRQPPSRVEITIHGKTIARFGFAIIQQSLVAKVAMTWGPDGPAGKDDVSGEDMRDAMLSVFRRYRQESIFSTTVQVYEAKLIGDGMIPEKARKLSHAIVSILAGPLLAGTIDRKKRLDQHLTKDRPERGG